MLSKINSIPHQILEKLYVAIIVIDRGRSLDYHIYYASHFYIKNKYILNDSKDYSDPRGFFKFRHVQVT